MSGKTAKILRITAEKLGVPVESAKKAFKNLSHDEKQKFLDSFKRKATYHGQRTH